MPRCPRCHTESRASGGICPRCGQPLSGSIGDSLGAPRARGWSGGGGGGSGFAGDPRPHTPRLAASNNVVDSGPASQPPRGDSSNNPAGSQPNKAAPQPAPIAHLVYKERNGTDNGPNVIILAGQDVTIGRAPGCDVTLADDPLASRRHSMLRYDGHNYTVKDLGSSNGTYINDVEIHEVTTLTSGDRITVGEHEFAYMDAAVPLTGQGIAGAGRERYNTDGYEVRTPPSWPPSRGSRPSSPPAASPEASVPAAPVHVASPSGAISAVRDPMAHDIEELRTRLMEVSTALAQRTGSAEDLANRLSEIMGELRERVERALAIPGASAPDGAAEVQETTVDEVVRAAQATVENPRHLDVLTALAGHAGAIAQTIEAQRRYIAALETTRAGLVGALREMRTRLVGLLDDEPAASAGDAPAPDAPPPTEA